MTLSGQSAISYTYDSANRLLGIQQGTQTVSFAYDTANRRTQTTLPNLVSSNYAYDSASQVTSISYVTETTTLGTLTYGYDGSGRRVSVGGTFSRANLPSAIGATIYNANNQLTTWNGTAYGYDAAGAVTSDGTYNYVWNSRGLLAQIKQGGTVVADFQYDALGRRSKKTIGGTATQFLYDGQNFVAELDGAGLLTAAVLTGPSLDEVFTRTTDSNTRFLLQDQLGDTIAETDSGGAIQTTYSYEPYGATTQVGVAGVSTQRYTGREQDDDPCGDCPDARYGECANFCLELTHLVAFATEPLSSLAQQIGIEVGGAYRHHQVRRGGFQRAAVRMVREYEETCSTFRRVSLGERFSGVFLWST
jgi:YD repeat-containing protein